MDVPTLPETHTGIPRYLLEKAKATKETIVSLRTEGHGKAPRSVVVPKGMEESVFLEAFNGLKEILGAENAELNDKPLKDDGW